MKRSSAILLTLASVVLGQAPIVGQDTVPPTEHRIGIRRTTDFAEFFDVTTDKTFVPRGNNYVQLRFDPTGTFLVSGLFLPEYHDPADVEVDFERMQALGYNTARIFIDLCRGENCIADVAGGLRDDFMDNVVSLLHTARRHDVFVLFTANWLPDVGGYTDAHLTCPPTFELGNCLLLSAEGVAGYRKFFEDFVQGLLDRDAPLDIILGYQLRNEVFMEDNLPPLNMTSGMVRTANGQTYDMAAADDKRRMVDDGLVFWANEARTGIRLLDPTALVTAGFFPPNAPHEWRPGDLRLVQTREILRESDLDFLDFHGYPSAGLTMEQMVENYGMTGFESKPVILGEFGAFLSDYDSPEQAAPHMQRWQGEACAAGFDGYLYWLWDPSEAPRVGDSVWARSMEPARLPACLRPCTSPTRAPTASSRTSPWVNRRRYPDRLEVRRQNKPLMETRKPDGVPEPARSSGSRLISAYPKRSAGWRFG